MEKDLIKSLKEKVKKLEYENSELKNEIQDFSTSTYRKYFNEKEIEIIHQLFSTKTIEGVVILQNYEIVYTNYRLPEILGYTKVDVLNFNFVNVIHKEDIPIVKERYDKRISGENPINQYYIRLIHKDGSLRWIFLRSSFIIWNNKPSILAILTDVTEQKETEEKLHFIDSKYKLLYNSLNDILLYFDKNKILLSANKYALDFFQETNVLKKNIDALFPPIFAKKLNKRFDEILKNEKTFEKEDEVNIKNRTHWLLSTYNPIFNQDEEIIGVQIIIKDITNQKKIEKQLVNAKNKAEESDKLKSSFLANMSHEIRTPMNGIIGFAELLKDEYIEHDTRKEYLTYINSCSENLLNLIDEIIDISKIEAGQISISKLDFRLDNLLNELSLFYNEEKNKIGKNHISISLKKTSQNKVIFTDPNRLKQILINLINNSLKFTDKGSIEFGYNINEENNFVFYVKDTGKGISEQKQKFIFNRFYQIENTSKYSYRGAGLGLSISKSLLELLGGKIWVVSQLNKGAIFYFTIPGKHIESRINNNFKQSKSTDTKFNWKDYKILIVEDDDINFILLKEALKKTKINIERAIDGIQAIDFINKNIYDIIFLDIQLPLLDGFAVLDYIKASKNETPVFIQTAYAMANEKNKCISAGCDEYLTKPIKIKELYALLEYYLNEKQS